MWLLREKRSQTGVGVFQLDLYAENFRTKTLSPGPLPLVDLSPHFLGIKNQGVTGSCVAFGVVAAMEFILQEAGHRVDLSEKYLYVLTRKRDCHRTSYGTYIHSALAVAKELGICETIDCPYNYILPIRDKSLPTERAIYNAKKYKAATYRYVPRTIRSFRKLLAKHIPIIISMRMWSEFSIQGLISYFTSIVPKVEDESHGNHCVLLVGYDDEKRLLKFRNSWGTSWLQWGSEGYGYIRYEDVENVNDAWIITKVHVKVMDFGNTSMQIVNGEFS